ncbi:MAG: acyl-CoA dehydrogenase family protein [Deltaproteobacteria bacterium]|nr:acyl-CoA dehydrogenase family protein [Deltaproteobacteria bacterium]
MDYELNEAQKKLQLEAAAFCSTEIAPSARKLDEGPKEKAFTLLRENLKKLAGAGFLGAGVDDAGIDMISNYIVAEEIAKVCPATYLSGRASTFLCGGLIALFGTAAQKERYLPGLLKGDLVGAVAYSESEAGSDISGITAAAKKGGDTWVLTGEKDIVANGPIADLLLVLAYTSAEAGAETGMSFFIVEKGAPGLTVGETIDTMGLRGLPLSSVSLSECRTAEFLGGEPGRGHAQLKKILSMGTVGITAFSVGIGTACMEKATAQAKNRKAFGRKIGSFQDVGFKLADMFTYNDLGRMLALRAAWAMNKGEEEADVIGACAKLLSTEAASKIANWTMQIFAGHGYLKGSEAERLYRDAKFGEICEGTSEMQRVFIAKNELDKFTS